MNSARIPEKLYSQFVEIMPIVCVDLLVKNSKGQILLLMRKNEPVKNHWWFPGGRVHYGELRQEAARRKLSEECGLEAMIIKEIGTFDLILGMPEPDMRRHGVTTLFKMIVTSDATCKIDDSSIVGEWRTEEDWNRERLHQFIRYGLSCK